MLGVYDGMGGDACGEVAALFVARGTVRLAGAMEDHKESLQRLCMELNREDWFYGERNCTGNMGAAAVMDLFAENGISFCNLGNNRIYKLDREGIRQFFRDHVLEN